MVVAGLSRSLMASAPLGPSQSLLLLVEPGPDNGQQQPTHFRFRQRHQFRPFFLGGGCDP